MSHGSGWVVSKIEKMFVDIARYQPLAGRSYLPLPDYLKVKKAIVNVQNTDDQCLKWALLSALHPAVRHAQRVSKYLPYSQELDFSGVDFPATLSDVSKVCCKILLLGTHYAV